MSKNLLENIYLFKGLSNAELELVNEICSTDTFPPGEDIFAEGDEARAIYFIKFGSVRIHQRSTEGDNIEVATLGTGSHFGEMPFIDGEKRSATATAIEKTDVLVIPFDRLNVLLQRNTSIAVHFYRELAHFLCGRLRITTNDLSFAREKNLSHF